MADKNIQKTKKATRRRRRVRGHIFGTANRPRLTVAKSLNNIFAQIIDDEKQVTLAAVASNGKVIKADLTDKMNKTEVAKKVGERMAQVALEKGIESVVFDRNRNRFQGRVKAVADGAREAGLKF
jgi:large subunit ribosomal protein L18